MKILYYRILYISYRRYIMKKTSTIQLDKSVIAELKKLKRYPLETYTELIKFLIEEKKESE